MSELQGACLERGLNGPKDCGWTLWRNAMHILNENEWEVGGFGAKECILR